MERQIPRLSEPYIDASLPFLDSWLEHRRIREDVPGLAVSVAHRGEVVFAQGYGFANMKRESDMTPNHLFRIASLSKVFTATAVLQLAERGLFELDAQAINHLPWLATHSDQRVQTITIRQLLSHGAGIIRDGVDGDYMQLIGEYPDQERLRGMILDSELVINNGEQLKYSNLGYGMLGMLIEATSGVSYEEYIRQHVLAPLNLKNTGTDFSEQIRSQLVTGYTRKDLAEGRLPSGGEDVRVKSLASASGYYSSPRDLCKFFAALFSGSNSLLSDHTKKEMLREVWPIVGKNRSYGLGVVIEKFGDRTVYGHSGIFLGQHTSVVCDPENDLVVVAANNCIDKFPDAHGTLSVFDYYRQNWTSSERGNPGIFEGRFVNYWYTRQILSMGGKDFVSLNDPDRDRPFTSIERLRRIGETVLSVVDGHEITGERVNYSLTASGIIETISYDGKTMWPENTWLTLMRKKRGNLQ